MASSLGPFSRTRFRFTTGIRSGEVAHIRGENDEVLLTYRSFAGVIGVIAALVSGIVMVAGVAAVLFLFAEGAPVRAIIAAALTLIFAFIIGLLSPRTNVTLYDDGHPAVTISQQKLFPAATYVVAAPNGAHLAELRKSLFSRLGRNRWTILQDGRYVGDAAEDSFPGALVRKVAGKFSRSFETDVRLTFGGMDVGRVRRRRDEHGRADVLELTGDALDRRVAVGLATLILGGEP